MKHIITAFLLFVAILTNAQAPKQLREVGSRDSIPRGRNYLWQLHPKAGIRQWWLCSGYSDARLVLPD